MEKKKGIGINCSMEYKKLRAFISAITGKKLGEIDRDVAAVIFRDKKSVEKILDSTRNFAWGEAKNAAKYFINSYKDTLEVSDQMVLRIFITSFLKAAVLADWQAGAELEFIDKFMKDNFGIDEISETSHANQANRVYSNMPNIYATNMLIRKYVEDEIDAGVTQGKIIFLDGFTGTGKSYVAAYYTKMCIVEMSDVYSAVIWNEDSGGNLTLNTLVSNILSTFEHENVANMNTTEKISAALRYLNAHKSILVIDNFESISSDEKNSILKFLLERVSSETTVIITCKNTMDTYTIIKHYMGKFHEVRLSNLTFEQWGCLLSEIEHSNSDVKEALAAYPDLNRFVFEMGEGNPYGTSHLLTAISVKLTSGISFEKIKNNYFISDIDKSSHDWIVKKSISELSENDKKLLISLCLFAVPATPNEISTLSGLQKVDIDGSVIINTPLYISMLNCHQQILIERVITKSAIRFSLPPLLRPILRGELKEDKDHQFDYIVKNWLGYFKALAGDIGFCYDDFSRLEILDNDLSAKQSENLKVALDYCYRNGLWADYYEISENTKYYFYTRGVSGVGNQSVHYKRAHAARMLNDKVAEFNSLLYHCNVSCKSKEWAGIDDCFKRIDTLKNTVDGIEPIDFLKLTYIMGLYFLEKGDYSSSNKKFSEYEQKIIPLRDTAITFTEQRQLKHDYIACLRWHSVCLYHLALCKSENTEDYMTKAFDLLNEAIELAEPINFKRAVVHSLLLKVQIALDVASDTDQARDAFSQLEPYLSTINNDVSYNAEYTQLKAKINQGV